MPRSPAFTSQALSARNSHLGPGNRPPPARSHAIEQAGALTVRLLKAGAAAFGIPVPRVAVRFDLGGTLAGQARMLEGGRFLIRYNPELLARNGAGFLERTVPHEVAHLITYCRFGRKAKPHGLEWREVMGFFGADPARCHDYDISGLSRRSLQRFPYHCACADHDLTSIRHRRNRAGTSYRCRRCGEPLRPGHRQTTTGAEPGLIRGAASNPG